MYYVLHDTFLIEKPISSFSFFSQLTHIIIWIASSLILIDLTSSRTFDKRIYSACVCSNGDHCCNHVSASTCLTRCIMMKSRKNEIYEEKCHNTHKDPK